MNTKITDDVIEQESVFLSNLHYFYAQTDGTYAIPNSKDGDMLKRAKVEIEQLRAQLQRQREHTGEAVPDWTDKFECCGNFVVGAEYMGAVEMVCCGNPEPAGVPPSPSRELLEPIKVFDSGAPRGERRWWHVEVLGVEVFSTTKRRDAEQLAEKLNRALLPQEPKEEGKS